MKLPKLLSLMGVTILVSTVSVNPSLSQSLKDQFKQEESSQKSFDQICWDMYNNSKYKNSNWRLFVNDGSLKGRTPGPGTSSTLKQGDVYEIITRVGKIDHCNFVGSTKKDITILDLGNFKERELVDGDTNNSSYCKNRYDGSSVITFSTNSWEETSNGLIKYTKKGSRDCYSGEYKYEPIQKFTYSFLK